VQTYQCKECGKKFSSARRRKQTFIKKLWKEYVFHKQTIRELAKTYKMDRRMIRAYLTKYVPPRKVHMPRAVHLVVDGTYFGIRGDDTEWCMVVFRDPHAKENLWWRFCNTETTGVYREGSEYLESLGYTIRSVTGDGFGGIRQAFSGTPFQMCHVHMERLVTNGTTKNPQTEAGQVLLALVRTLGTTDSRTFMRRLENYRVKYRSFLNERTVNPLTGESRWTHEGVRQALNSLIRFQSFLFTYETDDAIVSTSNTLEGHFSHINRVTSIHRGISRTHKERVLHTILLASSVAPTEKTLSYTL